MLGFCFHGATFALGTWWLYVSIHGFGQAPAWLALVLMSALVAIMAGWLALVGWLTVRFLPRDAAFGAMVAMPALFLLVEWWRGWFLSGFPWLSLGYSLSDVLPGQLAPVGGVYLLSLVVLLWGGALVALVTGGARARVVALLVLALPWLLGAWAARTDWTRAEGAPLEVALLQGAVPQDLKWLESNADSILDTYAGLHEQARGARLIVWPESALPDFANALAPYIGSIWSRSRRDDTDVLMGVMRLENGGREAYNSLLALGEADSPAWYDKHHLVPFGEYFPVPDFVREWARLMSLPHSDFDAGARVQDPLRVAGTSLSASICYEDAYGSAQIPTVRRSALLVNVTNDAWFGRSSARYMHLQIARMRALESRRWMLRAANDGVTAVIDPRGAVVARAPEFEPAVLRATVQPRTGDTPYLVVGNWPVVGASVLALALAGAGRWRRRPSRAMLGASGPRESVT